MRVECGASARPHYDGGSCSRCQFPVSTHEVGMKMSFKYVLNISFVLRRHSYILLYITQWIYNGNGSFALNIICRLREAAGIYLFNSHRRRLFIPQISTKSSGKIMTLVMSCNDLAVYTRAESLMIRIKHFFAIDGKGLYTVAPKS